MAHYAFLDDDNYVTQVIVGKDEFQDGIDWEEWYANFQGQKCKRTSYNTFRNVHSKGGEPFRKNYAGIGYFYDEKLDAFIPPKCHDEAVLNENIGAWDCPNETHTQVM